jgi:outer membrane murein-binding lipoprotein Lpp
LEAAEAVAQTGLDLAVEQMTKDVATLQATVTALKAQTEQLQADFKALQIPPAGASTEEVTAQIQALRAELSTELNALKVKASGDSVAGDDAIRLKTGQDGGNENGKLQVDLLQTVKDAKIKIIPGLA